MTIFRVSRDISEKFISLFFSLFHHIFTLNTNFIWPWYTCTIPVALSQWVVVVLPQVKFPLHHGQILDPGPSPKTVIIFLSLQKVFSNWLRILSSSASRRWLPWVLLLSVVVVLLPLVVEVGLVRPVVGAVVVGELGPGQVRAALVVGLINAKPEGWKLVKKKWFLSQW